MKDLFVVIALVVSMATMVTAHVAIAYGLVRMQPRWRAAVGFLVAPLACYWAYREKMKVRLWFYLGAFVLYAGATLVAKL